MNTDIDKEGNYMKKEEFSFRSNNDLADIRAVEYVPDGPIRAILQIAHGMDEFIGRYDAFAEYLNSKGFLVVGNDHLGHGGSVNSPDDWGYFGEHGNQTLLEDMHKLTELTKAKYPDVPYFLLGHSMGSFYARQYITTYGKELKGAIIMGTGFEPLYKLQAAKALCKAIAMVKGWKHRIEMGNEVFITRIGLLHKQFVGQVRVPCFGIPRVVGLAKAGISAGPSQAWLSVPTIRLSSRPGQASTGSPKTKRSSTGISANPAALSCLH